MKISIKDKSEVEIYMDGVYKGIEIANNILKDHNLKISVPSKSKILKMYFNK